MGGLRHGLSELRVVDLSEGIAGGYATKLLADAGADVVKVERPGGDPLRRHSATGADLGGDDAPLFRFLHAGKRSLVGAPDDRAVVELIARADLVVESFAPAVFDAEALARRHAGLVVLSITPFGRSGPWRDRPWSEFTLQAASGAIGKRGLPGGEPFQIGARMTEWVAAGYAAVAALAAVRRTRRTGRGEHVDLSLLEAIVLAGTSCMDLVARLAGVKDFSRLPQTVETPSIEPTADGYVGFCTNSRQQFSDFLVLIERPDLAEDEELAQASGRAARLEEWSAIVREWTRRHTTAEILERAGALRIPAAPVLNGATVREHEQVVARGMLRPDASGRVLEPRPPFRFDDEDPPPPRQAPGLGEHQGRVEWPLRHEAAARAGGAEALPLEGVRILDLTAWWAGPSSTAALAALGADVIHVESAARPDGMRHMGGMARHRYAEWWEAGALFLASNANKRGLTLDLSRPEGRALLLRLAARSDALVENYTPRVLDGFGLGWDALHEASPHLILVRMPAFGLSGPWRERPGFAQTMEQLTGLAWVTGHPDDQPRIQQGPCDPLAGMHAAFALLVALAERERTGRGLHVEASMVEAALNAAAEQIVELGAFGRVMERMGNRSPTAAPQGLYACAGSRPGAERWLALSVESDEQWRGLRETLGRPRWAEDAALDRYAGRRAAEDEIDVRLRRWAARIDRDEAVERLLGHGVPAAAVADPRLASRCPQLRARGFFEEVDRAVVGRHPLPTLPFRYRSVPRWIRRPAPTLGEHSREILGGFLDLSPAELDALEAAGVIGTRPPV